MKPTFRADLTCSREEQQGVVFYRIDDPKAQTSFRLYEIEYLIAKKLDGSRSVPEVIETVKKEFNFDISEPDLQRFINQLESMGFLHGGREAGGGAEEADTAVMTQPGGSAAPEAGLDLLDQGDGDGTGGPDQAELDRLLRSAFLHVKQGYVVHARDYFLAAKELNPADDRLATLVNHLETIGDQNNRAEVEYLWNQASELFPEVAAEVGPLSELPPDEAPLPMDASDDVVAPSKEEDIRSRLLWFLLLVLILAIGGGGLYWGIRTFGLLEGAVEVKVTSLRAESVPVFFENPATDVQPLAEKWLAIESAGKVAQIMATEGQKVQARDLLVSLQLSDRIGKPLAKARRNLKKAEAAHAKNTEKLEKLMAEREAIEAGRNEAEARLKELRPKSVLGQGGVSKRDLERWKLAKVEANKKLTRLAKKERGPRKQAAKTEKRLEVARAKVDEILEQARDRFIQAPFAGTIVKLKAAGGAMVKAGDKLVLLRDPSGVRITFQLPEKPETNVGGEAQVAVGRGKPGRAKVLSIVPGEGGSFAVGVKLLDPAGGFVEFDPDQFRLVRHQVDPAFRLPAGAVIGDAKEAYVLVVAQERALKRKVEVLQRDAATAVIKDVSGSIRDGDQLVEARLGEGDLAAVSDGTTVTVVQP